MIVGSNVIVETCCYSAMVLETCCYYVMALFVEWDLRYCLHRCAVYSPHIQLWLAAGVSCVAIRFHSQSSLLCLRLCRISVVLVLLMLAVVLLHT